MDTFGIVRCARNENFYAIKDGQIIKSVRFKGESFVNIKYDEISDLCFLESRKRVYEIDKYSEYGQNWSEVISVSGDEIINRYISDFKSEIYFNSKFKILILKSRDNLVVYNYDCFKIFEDSNLYNNNVSNNYILIDGKILYQSINIKMVTFSI